MKKALKILYSKSFFLFLRLTLYDPIGSRKKKIFFSGAATNALTTLELSGHIYFGKKGKPQKKSFFSGQALTPPPLLVAGPLNNTFFCSFP